MGDTTVQFSLLGNDYGTYMILVDGTTGDILSTIPVDVTWPTGDDALLKDVTISEYLKTLGSTKGLQIAILDENGDQITDFGGDTSSLATEASLQLITALIDAGKLKIENDLDISSLATEASLQLITALIDSGSLKVVDSLGATAAKQDTIIENQTSGDQKTQIVQSDGETVVESFGETKSVTSIKIIDDATFNATVEGSDIDFSSIKHGIITVACGVVSAGTITVKLQMKDLNGNYIDYITLSTIAASSGKAFGEFAFLPFKTGRIVAVSASANIANLTVTIEMW